ncbi:MAG: hypothetical protein OEW11_06050 [Nitrospirota bacterium]|nr:hypothetical protein [Nitrospirota bacterium]
MHLPKGIKTTPDGRIVFHVPRRSPLRRVIDRDRQGRFTPTPKSCPERPARFRKNTRKPLRRRRHYSHPWHDARGRFCVRPPMSLKEILALVEKLRLGQMGEQVVRLAWERQSDPQTDPFAPPGIIRSEGWMLAPAPPDPTDPP